VRAKSIDRPTSVPAAATTASRGTRTVPLTSTSSTRVAGDHTASQTSPRSSTTPRPNTRRRRRRRARTRAANRSADVGETVGRARGPSGSVATCRDGAIGRVTERCPASAR
jgi:hypothetical protein